MSRQALGQLGVAELGWAITERHRSVVAQQAELIELIAEYARRGAWAAEGAASMQNWLVATLNVTYPTACEWVRLGEELDSLPVLSEALGSGSVSLDAAAAAAQLATPATDAELAQEARELPAGALRRAAQRARAGNAQEGGEPERRALHLHAGPDGWWRMTGWLAPEQGAAVMAALERLAGDEVADPVTGAWPRPEEAAADALVALASTALAADADPDRACVVVHVDVEDLVSGQGAGQLAGGGAVPASVVRRLSCDGRIEIVASDDRGVRGIATLGRQVPARMERYIRHRDQTCRFPGCGRRRHLHAHHLVHWSNGGATDVGNLVLLCPRHHRFVHEHGWVVIGNPEPGPGRADALKFLRPDGRLYEPLAHAGAGSP